MFIGGNLKSKTIEKGLNWVFARQDVRASIVTAKDFSDMYERNHIAVYRYIYGLTGGPPSEVEDFTSETFTRAWKNRQSYYGEPANAIGWVLRIARNLVIDHYRSQHCDFLLDTDFLDEAMISPEIERQQPEHSLVDMEQQALILHLLLLLPPSQRELLVLRYFLDWKVNRIGSYLDIPENTVSVSIRRALEKIRTQWPVDKEMTL
jgi:RNA polymerase sigma-70 factor, ECF subfamily